MVAAAINMTVNTAKVPQIAIGSLISSSFSSLLVSRGKGGFLHACNMLSQASFPVDAPAIFVPTDRVFNVWAT